MKKAKFSAIDVLIVAVLAVVIIFGFLKVKGMIFGADTNKKVRFSVMATGVPQGTEDLVTIGEEVSISVKEKAYAKVVAVKETPHHEVAFNQNTGKYTDDIVEDIADIVLEFECMADVSETEILNNNVPIRVGEASTIHGKLYSLKGFIITVDEVSE